MSLSNYDQDNPQCSIANVTELIERARDHAEPFEGQDDWIEHVESYIWDHAISEDLAEEAIITHNKRIFTAAGLI